MHAPAAGEASADAAEAGAHAGTGHERKLERRLEAMSVAAAATRSETRERAELTDLEVRELMDDGRPAASPWPHMDVLVLLTVAASCLVLFWIHEARNELPIILLSVVTLVLFLVGRFVFSWARDYISWEPLLQLEQHLLLRRLALAFWTLQLIYSYPNADFLAPLVHARLTGARAAVVMWTFTLVGFVMGAEAGSVRTKLQHGAATMLTIMARQFILASRLQGEAATQLICQGFAILVVSPCIGVGLGMVTRVKLDAQAAKIEQMHAAYAGAAAAADELQQLRNHAFQLEAARKEALLRKHGSSKSGSASAGDGSGSGSEGARRRAARAAPPFKPAADLGGISET